MNTVVRRTLEMVRRVREFIRAHLSIEPGYAPALGRFEESLTRAEAIAARQQEGRTAERAARAQRKELRRVLHFQLIRYLVSVGSPRARGEAEKELLDDLGGMVAKFETALEAIRTGRRDHIGARADLDAITGELVDQVKVLDGITRYRFGDDPEVMAEWKAVRRVPGQPQAEGTPPAGQGVVPPTSGAGGSIAPAA